jgi:hypothetical protein
MRKLRGKARIRRRSRPASEPFVGAGGCDAGQSPSRTASSGQFLSRSMAWFADALVVWGRTRLCLPSCSPDNTCRRPDILDHGRAHREARRGIREIETYLDSTLRSG